jgi:two-component system chemotaxis response regulator CheY
VAVDSEVDVASRTVLIVDDSSVSRKILRSCLPKDRTFALLEAADGEAGLSAHRAHRPEITFLDLTMPGMDGFTCLAEIRSSSPDAVVVVVTADVQTQSLERALQLGAMEILKKPPSKETVGAVLARAEARLGLAHGA